MGSTDKALHFGGRDHDGLNGTAVNSTSRTCFCSHSSQWRYNIPYHLSPGECCTALKLTQPAYSAFHDILSPSLIATHYCPAEQSSRCHNHLSSLSYRFPKGRAISGCTAWHVPTTWFKIFWKGLFLGSYYIHLHISLLRRQPTFGASLTLF